MNLFVIQELRPLLAGSEATLLALVSVYYSLPSCEGRVLHKTMTKSVTAVLEALQNLIKSLSARYNNDMLVSIVVLLVFSVFCVIVLL